MEINYQDFDFKSRLIKRYLNYELSENDVMVILVSDELLKDEPNRLLTADSLAPFMHLSPDEIDAVLFDQQIQSLLFGIDKFSVLGHIKSCVDFRIFGIGFSPLHIFS